MLFPSHPQISHCSSIEEHGSFPFMKELRDKKKSEKSNPWFLSIQMNFGITTLASEQLSLWNGYVNFAFRPKQLFCRPLMWTMAQGGPILK